MAAAVALLAGCAPVALQRTEGRGPVPVAVRIDDAAFWLEEWHRAITLPEDALERTLQARELDFENNPGPRTRLRLALLLAEGKQPVRDQSRALKLLKDMKGEAASASARALAALLEQVIGEQLWAGEKISGLRKELKASRARIQELERQLQELTSIEQSIQDRTKKEVGGSQK